MLKTTNDWLLNMDQGLYTGVVYFDLKRAFDTVDYSILLSKLSRYGVNDVNLNGLSPICQIDSSVTI